MKTTLRTTACAGLLVAALAACTPAEDISGSATSSQSQSAARTLSAEQLRSSAITAQDLPSGWTQEPDSTATSSRTTSGTDEKSGCPAVQQERERHPLPESKDDFTRSFRRDGVKMLVAL